MITIITIIMDIIIEQGFIVFPVLTIFMDIIVRFQLQFKITERQMFIIRHMHQKAEPVMGK